MLECRQAKKARPKSLPRKLELQLAHKVMGLVGVNWLTVDAPKYLRENGSKKMFVSAS